MNIQIRPEKADDVEAIEKVTVEAFLNVPYAQHTEQHITKALSQANALTISLVVEVNEKLVAHVAISQVSISDKASGWYGLGPISVIPAYQRQGIGTRLIQFALSQLQSQGASGCVLLGNPNYYKRFGFKSEQGLVLPNVPAEYFQALSFGPPIPRGTVSYHPAFNSTS